MAGDDETGVTIHRTTPELDAGPVAAQRSFLIGAEDDAGVVYERPVSSQRSCSRGLQGLSGLPPSVRRGGHIRGPLTPEDRELDWNRPPQSS